MLHFVHIFENFVKISSTCRFMKFSQMFQNMHIWGDSLVMGFSPGCVHFWRKAPGKRFECRFYGFTVLVF